MSSAYRYFYTLLNGSFGYNSKLTSKFHTAAALRSNILKHSPNAKLDKTLTDKYMCLPMPECVSQVKYVWIDGTGIYLRSKTKTLNFLPGCPQEVPKCFFDASSTLQGNVKDSEGYLLPVALYKDPFSRGNNKLVLCEAYGPDNKPTGTNHRIKCAETLRKVKDCEPEFAFHQEFYLLDFDRRPFGWPALGEPQQSQLYSCSVGGTRCYGREIIESFYRCCLYAGVRITGACSEQAPSQWYYDIKGPGEKLGDDSWMARYILWRLAEEYGLDISFHPKLYPNWPGSGGHMTFSTKEMREENGYKAIETAICRLCKKHQEHLNVYDQSCGKHNALRLTGRFNTSNYMEFTQGIGDRTASVMIRKEVATSKKGALQDRRPAADCDPYVVIHNLLKTCVLCE